MRTKILNHVLYWWGIWGLRHIDWNLGWFVWFLLLPAMLYLQVSALVGASPSQVVSWRDHFYAMGSWFFVVNALNVSHTFVTATILLELPLLHPMRFVQVSIFACSIAGSVSTSPRVHAFVGPAIFLLVALGFGSLLFFPPGPASM